MSDRQETTLDFFAAFGLAGLGAVLIALALTLWRSRRIEATGRGMVYRRGRIEIVTRVTDDDLSRAFGERR